MMLKDYSQAYLDIMDSDPNTKSYEKMLPMGYDITGKEDRFKEIFKNKKNHFRRFRDLSIFAFAGVYLLSVVDAYVENGGFGAAWAAPIASLLVEKYLNGEISDKRKPLEDRMLNADLMYKVKKN